MNKETVDSIINAIKPVAEKIGEGAAHLYEIYVKQMFAEGLAGLIASGVVVIIIIIGIVAWKKYAAKPDADDDVLAMTAVFGGMISLFALVMVMAFLTTNLTMIINPEYHAVQRILETVKGQ